MKDILVDQQTGLLVPIRSPESLASAVDALRADRSFRARLGRAARADAQGRYTWDRSAEPVLRVYEALTQTRTTGAANRLPAVEAL